MDGRKLMMQMREKANKQTPEAFTESGYLIERLFRIIEDLLEKVQTDVRESFHVWTMYGNEGILIHGGCCMVKTEKMDRIDLRITREQKKLLARAAALSGVSMSSFLVNNALDQAKRIVVKSETITLSDRDRDLFYSILKNPPKPNKNLVKLMRNHRR
jgi:uncharacterized protein (DUF1778 family)